VPRLSRSISGFFAGFARAGHTFSSVLWRRFRRSGKSLHPTSRAGYRADVATNSIVADLAIIGGGNMGEAILGGLLRDSGFVGRIAVVEVLSERQTVLSDRYPTVSVLAETPPCVAALIAVKPPDVPAAITIAVAQGAKRVLSIAAGVTLETMQAAAGEGVAIVRSMPNTPALVGAGAAAIAGGPLVTEADLAWAEQILGAVGTVVRVPEHLLNAVTGLAGSGPAYLMLIAEALIEGGVLVGLPRATARELTTQLLVGSAQLLAQTGELPEVLRANVTSPGGTTAAGLYALEQHGVRAAILDAVKSATERGQELANPHAAH
jgi:pyrroline-5-carboxylate reductase